jgi:uncharacterized protein (TIGR03437 family)
LYSTHVSASAVDAAGNVYLTGLAAPDSIPVTPGAFQTQKSPCACSRAYILKAGADGTLQYATYLSGSGFDQPNTIAIDASGGVYVAGITGSTDFPVSQGAYRRAPGSGFISRLSPDGSSLIASTYVAAQAWRLVLDADGNVYVAGRTGDPTFATTPGAFQAALLGPGDAFVLKIDPLLRTLFYSTLLGSGRDDTAYGLKVDASGSAYVTGVSNSGGGPDSGHPFPVTPGAYGGVFTGLKSAFVSRLSPDGSHLIFSALLAGGTAYDIVLDETGAVYFGGDADPQLYSLPVTIGAYRGTGSGFVTKLNADGSRLVYSTRLPGRPRQLNLTGDHHVLATGLTFEQLTTTPDAPHPCSDGKQEEQFLLEFNTAGSDRVYGTYLKYGLATDGVTVWSAPSHAPAVANQSLEHMPIHGSGEAGITCVANAATFRSGPIAPGEIVSIFGGLIGPDAPATTQLDESGKVATGFGGVSVYFNGDPAPLLYVSKNQINAVAPFELSIWPSTYVTIVKDGVVLPEVNIPVAPAVPGVFALVNQDGTVNNSSHPARQGSYVTLYATGAGLMQPSAATGSVGQGTTSIAQQFGLDLFWPSGAFRVTYVNLVALYAGDAPTLVQGVVAIVAQVPTGVPAPEVATTTLEINVGGARTYVPIIVR